MVATFGLIGLLRAVFLETRLLIGFFLPVDPTGIITPSAIQQRLMATIADPPPRLDGSYHF